MIEWTQVTDFLNQYAVILALLVVMGGLAGYRKWKSFKEKKAQAKKLLELKAKNEKIQPPTPPEREIDWAGRFDNVIPGMRKEVDVITKIVNVGNEIDKRSDELVQSLRNDFNTKSLELQDIIIKKEQIREQGLKLANLYDKYREREMHLVNIMQSIEYMMNKGGSQPPDGRA